MCPRAPGLVVPRGRERQKRPSLEPQEGAWPRDTLTLDFWPPERERVKE